MGIITSLIQANRNAKQQDFNNHLGVLTQLASQDNLTDDAKKAVWGSIASLTGPHLDLPKAQHGVFGDLLHGFSKLNPAPSDPYAAGMIPLPPSTPAINSQVPDTSNPVPGQMLPGADATSPFLTPLQMGARANAAKTASEQAAFQQTRNEIAVKQAQIDKLYPDKTDQEYKDATQQNQTGIAPAYHMGNAFQFGSYDRHNPDGTITPVPTRSNPKNGEVRNALTGALVTEADLTGSRIVPDKSNKTGASATVTQADKQNELYFRAYALKNGLSYEQVKADPSKMLLAEHFGRAQTAGNQYGTMTQEGIDAVADKIHDGSFGADMKGIGSRNSGAVMASLALRHPDFNLAIAQNDRAATQKWIASMNSTNQIRLAQATRFTSESLDKLDDLNRNASRFIDRSRFGVWNKAAMQYALSGASGQEAQNAASLLNNQVGEVAAELALVYKGGNSPTDVGLNSAKEMLNGDWDESRLASAIRLARQNLVYRVNSMKDVGVAGLSQTSPYAKEIAKMNGTAPAEAGPAGAPAMGQPMRAPTVTPAPAAPKGKGSVADQANKFLEKKRLGK